MIEGSNQNMKKSFQALESLALTFTTHSKEQAVDGKPAGFVTIPDSEFHMGNTREVGGFRILGYTPIVEPEDFDAWSKYSQANIGWVNEQFEANGLPDRLDESAVSPVIFRYQQYDPAGNPVPIPDAISCFTASGGASSGRPGTGRKLQGGGPPAGAGDGGGGPPPIRPEPEEATDGPFLATWTGSPIPSERFLNVNMMRDPIYKEAYKIVSTSNKSTFLDTCAANKPGGNDGGGTTQNFNVLYSPVFDDFAGNETTLVGMLNAVSPWK